METHPHPPQKAIQWLPAVTNLTQRNLCFHLSTNHFSAVSSSKRHSFSKSTHCQIGTSIHILLLTSPGTLAKVIEFCKLLPTPATLLSSSSPSSSSSYLSSPFHHCSTQNSMSPSYPEASDSPSPVSIKVGNSNRSPDAGDLIKTGLHHLTGFEGALTSIGRDMGRILDRLLEIMGLFFTFLLTSEASF